MSDLPRDIETLQRMLEQERRKNQKTTLEEYLYNCHFHLYTKLQFADESKFSTGLATTVDNKYYPKWLRRWNTFASHQRLQVFDDIKRVCGESRLFHQESTTRNQGDTLSYQPASDENDIAHFERTAVEVPVLEILAPIWNQGGLHGNHQVTMLRFCHNGRDFTQPSDGLAGPERPPPMNPDGGGIRTHLDGDESMAFVFDFKAAHKFAAAHLMATLTKETLFQEVIARHNSNKYTSDAKVLEQESQEKRIAMALTQVFDYMVCYGVLYGYVAAGKSLVFLHMDRDDPRTLYYHLCMPDEDVVEASPTDRARQVPQTAVAQLASFCLLSLQSEALRGTTLDAALQKASKELKKWSEPYKDAVSLPEAEGANSSSSSSSSSQKTEDPDFQSSESPTGRVYPLRSGSSCNAAAVRRRNEDDDEEGPKSYLSRTWTRTDINKRREGPLSGSCENQETETSDPGPARQYCTQACLLSLKRGWDLDGDCPNVSLHRTTKGGIRHPIDAGEFTRLVGECLRQNPYRHCEALDGRGKFGATGVLFKIELAPYGYTFVGKGTILDHGHLLEHECSIYAHLDKLQGEVVPVHFDMVRLARGYVLPGGARVVYIMLMSWVGEVAAKAGVPDLAAEVTRSLQAVWAEGVRHGDEREPNLLWNEERRRVMLVDFDRANLRIAPKHRRLLQLSRDKKKRKRDRFRACGRKSGLP